MTSYAPPNGLQMLPIEILQLAYIKALSHKEFKFYLHL